MNPLKQQFGRPTPEGHVAVFEHDGAAATRIRVAASIYPVGSSLSAEYEHPDGITITRADAERIGMPMESDFERMLMNTATGSVDTAANWLAEMKEWETNPDGLTPQQQFDALIEVERDGDGWREKR